jgi:DUF2975 family protein
MPNIVELAPFADRPGAVPAAPHRWLPPLSRGLSWLFTIATVLSVLWLIAAFVVIFFFSNHVLVGTAGAELALPGIPHAKPGMVRFSDQPFATHLAWFVTMLIGIVPVGLICWHLRGLFTLYARSIVFARENATHLKRIGLMLVIWPLAKFGGNALFQAFGGTDRAWAQMIFVYAFILGLIVFVIAQVMEFGHEIEQEKDSFV